MQNIFREYDIRGIFEKELTAQSVQKIGILLARRIKPFGDTVALGYDARTHSPKLFEFLAKGLTQEGMKVLDMGLVPTPVNYFANYSEFNGLKSVASVMITGSHNPPEYNGFKITINKAPFFGEQIYELSREMDTAQPDFTVIPNVIKIDSMAKYVEHLTKEFSPLKNMKQKIVIDCGNGVAGPTVMKLIENLNLDVEVLYGEPDGTFPNHHPDPSDEENLHDVKEELKKGYDIAFAFDGDADRIAVLTKENNIKGDVLAILLAKNMENPTVIGEVKCSQVMYDEINKFGRAIMYKTGHSNLKVKIKETNAHLAAEVSGHLFFADRYFGYDDAIYAMFRVLELVNNGFNLDEEIAKLPKPFSTEEIKVKTTEEQKFKIVDKLKELLKNPPANCPPIREIVDIDGVRVIFNDGWGLVRASNTTPVLVTRFEASTIEKAKEYEDILNQMIEKAKGLL